MLMLAGLLAFTGHFLAPLGLLGSISTLGVALSPLEIKFTRVAEIQIGNFIVFSRFVRSHSGQISFEWPRYCSGWHLPIIRQMIKEFQLVSSKFFGCGCGVISKVTGLPIKKPWAVETTSLLLVDKLNEFQCTHELHSPCQGSDTKQTGFYPEPLADAIIVGLDPRIPESPNGSAVPSLVGESDTESE